MKKFNSKNAIPLFLILMVSLSSCQAIAGIFKAGVWVGIIIVVIIIAIVLWLISKMKK